VEKNKTTIMNYPSRIITIGEQDSAIVSAIQGRLNRLGFGPITEDGIFGRTTKCAIKAYQNRVFYRFSDPLEMDGNVGLKTWKGLFEVRTTAPSLLLTEVINIARKEIGICEEPPGSNNGPRVSAYLKSVRLSPGYPWCAAFVYWCFEQASAGLLIANPLVRTGACMQHWQRTKGVKISYADALANPQLIEPGAVFIIGRGYGRGHTGIVTGIDGREIHTIEGNTNAFCSANGGGVFELKRPIYTINTGFIKYT
jgi:hypothetical protein